MTIEGIEQYMSVELGDRMRTISSSELMRMFSQSFDTVQVAMKKFVNSSNCIDNVYVAVSEGDDAERKIKVIRLNEVSGLSPNASWWYYMIKPGNESTMSAWQREVEFMKTSVKNSTPGLWPGAAVYANTISDESVREREVQIRVEQQPTTANVSKPQVTASQNSGNKNKLGFSKMSGPVVAKEKEEIVVKSSASQSSSKVARYQVPLDSLGGQAPGTPERVFEADVVEPIRESPETKRQKIEDPPIVEEVDMSKSPDVPSSPQFREVVIKKKVVVSEYEMNEHGEMTIRDVEKMVEEVVREQVKVPDRRPKLLSSSAGGTKKKNTNSAPSAGQGTLTGFFKKT